MIRRPLRFAILVLGAAPLAAQQPHRDSLPTLAAAAAGYTRHDGFVPVLVDADRRQVRLELPDTGLTALFLVSQATGLGSNPIGIDRGASGRTEVVRFIPAGHRMLVRFENTTYRSSGDSLHRRTVTESFANSIVASLSVEIGRAHV